MSIEECSRQAVIAKGAEIDALDNDGQAALHLAVANGQTDAIEVRQMHSVRVRKWRRFIEGARQCRRFDQRWQCRRLDGTAHCRRYGERRDHQSENTECSENRNA